MNESNKKTEAELLKEIDDFNKGCWETKDPDEGNIRTYTNDRLYKMFSLKQYKYPQYWKIRNEYRQYNYDTDTYTDTKWDVKYHINTGFALVQTKASELLKNMPQFEFIGMDEEGRVQSKVRKMMWDYFWDISKTSEIMYKVILDSCKYGVGACVERALEISRTVREPEIQDDGTIKWTPIKRLEYRWPKAEYVPFENWFMNWPSVNESTEGAVVTYYDRADFFLRFWNNPLYSYVDEDIIPKGKFYVVPQNQQATLYLPWSSYKDAGIYNENIVSVLEYWNQPKDEYIVLANGIWINPEKSTGSDRIMPIITENKEIPILVWTDHYLEDSIYALGEMEVSSSSRLIEDSTFSAIMNGVRASLGFITIDPNADFDEATVQFATWEIVRVDPKEVGFFAPNVNLQILQFTLDKIREQIQVETGVDYTGMLFSPSSASATSVVAKTQSQERRIALCIMYNSYTFLEKLARIRMSNMEFMFKNKPTTIAVKGQDIDENGVASPVSGGYGTFTVMPSMWEGKCNCFPIADSMIGDSNAKQLESFMRLFQLVMNMVDPATGKPLIDPRVLIESGRWIIDDVVDLDKLLQRTPEKKDPKQILQDKGLISPQQNPQDQGWIPQAQRSWRPVLLPSQASPTNPQLWV